MADKSITRIPLTVVVVATGHETDGALVAVGVAELDALEASVDEGSAELRERVLAVLALHKPAPVEVELWCDDEGVTVLHDDFPDCAPGMCPGHVRSIPSCMECGYEVDYDATINYTKWPCATARALGVTP